jgi:hypothetical protein
MVGALGVGVLVALQALASTASSNQMISKRVLFMMIVSCLENTPQLAEMAPSAMSVRSVAERHAQLLE